MAEPTDHTVTTDRTVVVKPQTVAATEDTTVRVPRRHDSHPIADPTAEPPPTPPPRENAQPPAAEDDAGRARRIPVVYGARVRTTTELQRGVDQVQRRFGPAPEIASVSVRQGRELLPSFHRKEMRRRMVTLCSYGVVVAACAFGLWKIVSLALEHIFG